MALKGQGQTGDARRIIRRGNLFGGSVRFQEGTLFHAFWAIDARFQGQRELGRQLRPQGRVECVLRCHDLILFINDSVGQMLFFNLMCNLKQIFLICPIRNIYLEFPANRNYQ
jgi:hypothetical protein